MFCSNMFADELDSSSRDANTGIDTISYRMPATTFRTTAATTTTTTANLYL